MKILVCSFHRVGRPRQTSRIGVHAFPIETGVGRGRFFFFYFSKDDHVDQHWDTKNVKHPFISKMASKRVFFLRKVLIGYFSLGNISKCLGYMG